MSRTATSLLTPPEQFGIVEPGVYRSDMLQPIHFTFIKQFGFKTVVMLSPEMPSRVTSYLIEEGGIKLVHLGMATWKPIQPSTWRPISEELIKEGLELILNIDTHPVLIMCTSGIHETGTLVGCLRKLEGWNFSSIITEYRSYAGTKARYVNEQFIELFDLDLVTLPPNLPTWLIDQQRMLAEEEALSQQQ
ncbi:protein-tyrosine phosphatase [Radiomyces spectabilis]|uniref:protein-tyrosine phosphatase n=1 Tax=Radiomyces spectabilis TaxID=64574 RepID=UPI002220BE83|nr:protein-tyrosine phosphatase [Radiomyces spectabilis]KAI8370476.1 protein-tyrosine phosphatase [Radiomyces spectabilis]